VGPVTPTYPFDSYTTKLYDLETLTLRGGYAPGNWFWYGKAGVATGTINLSGVSGAPVPGVAFSNAQRQWGPTVGTGLEFIWMRHFVVGVEYDFTALSRESINTTATCSVLAACSVVPTTPVSVNGGTLTLSSVVGRLSYKFDWLPAPMAPRY
jgi:opacity protein-like surface antigen